MAGSLLAWLSCDQSLLIYFLFLITFSLLDPTTTLVYVYVRTYKYLSFIFLKKGKDDNTAAHGGAACTHSILAPTKSSRRAICIDLYPAGRGDLNSLYPREVVELIWTAKPHPPGRWIDTHTKTLSFFSFPTLLYPFQERAGSIDPIRLHFPLFFFSLSRQERNETGNNWAGAAAAPANAYALCVSFV